MIWIAVFAMLGLLGCSGENKQAEGPAQSLGELQKRISTVLQETHTPGVSIAIVRREGPEWVAGLGTADVAKGRPANADTLFRIGSVSKAFAALAVLLLVREGELSFDDPVRQVAPEVWFENRWEATDPVRVVHLLEHTTGWDDMHLREYAKDANGMDLREAFDFDHRSRISRWRPGTRMSYCNTGPAVAAYIVEKIAGMRFEDFVTQRLFQPIGMRTATYMQPAAETTTVLYHEDGKTPYPYWHILYRPAGSINASAKDMAAYVQFYLNRGKANETQVVPVEDIDRMEIPKSSWAAREGMKRGYGLGNYWSVQEGFVYHGHNGGVSGGLTELGYLTDQNAGYYFSINSGSGDAFGRIGKAVRGYLTRTLPKPKVTAESSLPPNAAEYTGWYEPDSPRNEITRFIERLAGLSWIHFVDGKLVASSLEGWAESFVPVGGGQFRHVPKDSKSSPDPVASLVLIGPKEEGVFIEMDFTMMRRIPGWLAVTEIVLTAFALLGMTAVLAYAPFWIVGALSRSRRRPAERWIRFWPLIALAALVALVLQFMADDGDAIAHLGAFTLWSAGLWLASVMLGVGALGSLIALWRAPKDVRRGVLWHARIATAAVCIVAAYFGYWGLLGIRTWA